MSNNELDMRIAACVAMIRTLRDDLSCSKPNVEQAVALGVIAGCVSMLELLHGHMIVVHGAPIKVRNDP